MNTFEHKLRKCKRAFLVFTLLIFSSIFSHRADAFESGTLTNQRTMNFTACTQGKCQGNGQDGGINVIKLQVGPFQNSVYYRIGDTPNDFTHNSQAGGIDPGADSMLGTGLVDWANVQLSGKANCTPGVDNRCVYDTNDVQPCGLTLPASHTSSDTLCASRTTVFASTAVPKRVYQNDADKGGNIILDQRITGSDWSLDATGFGTPSTDSFASWAYTDGSGNDCPPGVAKHPCRVTRVDFGMVSLYFGGNAGFTSANSSRTGFVINSITDGDGKIIGHIQMDTNGTLNPIERQTCRDLNSISSVYGGSVTCSVATFKDSSGAFMNRAIVLDGRATGWSHTDSNFNPSGGTPCPSNPSENDLLTCGAWAGPPTNLITTWKATGPFYTQATPIPFEGSGNTASNCLFRGTISSTATGSICDNIMYDNGSMGDPASPTCSGSLAGPTDQHGQANGGGACNGF